MFELFVLDFFQAVGAICLSAVCNCGIPDHTHYFPNFRTFTVLYFSDLLNIWTRDPCMDSIQGKIKATLVNVYVDLLVFTRIAGTS